MKAPTPSGPISPRRSRALRETCERSETAPPVIKKIHKRIPNSRPVACGLFDATLKGKPGPSLSTSRTTDLRDTEQVPLLQEGGIEAFIRREVLPYASDAWYVPDSVKVGYEISFTRHFYKPQPLRPLEEIRADIMALEQETEGLLADASLPRAARRT